MKTLSTMFFSLLLLSFTLVCRANTPEQEEASILNELESLWVSGDDVQLPACIDLLGTFGSTNAIAVLLPHLDYNPAIAQAEKAGSGAVVTTTGDRYVVADAIQRIGLPLPLCLSALTDSTPLSISESLLTRIGMANHGADMLSNVVANAETEGGRWLHVEHLCIAQTTVATNAGWPVSITLSQVPNGFSVAITNHLASSLVIPGEPVSISRNAIRIFTDAQHPFRYREYGDDIDFTLDNRPEDWFLSIPAHGGASFLVPWTDATNGIPTAIWNQAWAIQWALYDDMRHLFLSNLVPLP